MTAFDHFLLTRFSAVLTPAAAPAAEEWLWYRLGFFVDAALPSVAAQRGGHPTWLVLLDDRCPGAFRDAVEELAATGIFTPIWTHEPFRRNAFAAYVAERSTADHLITTRMDSDDALAVDFTFGVQREFSVQDRLFVNFTRGVQIDRSGAVYRSDQVSSPFLSLIERRDPTAPPLTVYAPKHARARTQGPLREVMAPPMWAQVLHGTNLSNIVNGPRISPRILEERFVLNLQFRRDVPMSQLLREKAVQRTRLARLWSAHPGEFTKYVEARLWRLRGTHTRPQDDDARTVTDAVAEAAERAGLRRRRHGLQ